MGYTTDFKGKFKFSKQLNDNQILYLKKLSNTRRIERNSSLCENFFDPVRTAVNLPVGIQGEFCVFGTGFAGQNTDPTVLNYNNPSKNQPSLWLQFEPDDEGKYYLWNQTEKFYCYFEWLAYVIVNILNKWDGIYLTGTIYYKGERRGDTGKIKAYKDKIEIYHGKLLHDTINF
jgi:hypothetical protein